MKALFKIFIFCCLALMAGNALALPVGPTLTFSPTEISVDWLHQNMVPFHQDTNNNTIIIELPQGVSEAQVRRFLAPALLQTIPAGSSLTAVQPNDPAPTDLTRTASPEDGQRSPQTMQPNPFFKNTPTWHRRRLIRILQQTAICVETNRPRLRQTT